MKKKIFKKLIICLLVVLMGTGVFMTGSVDAQAATTTTTKTSVTGLNNEKIIYNFLINEMKLNNAAACGVLANIYHESTFNPTAGRSYSCYGICQWTGTRLSAMKRYCSKNGYSYKSLTGQLNYMKYEMSQTANNGKKTYTYLKAVPNSAKGAYNAAYYWCYYYERPARKSYRSNQRGVLARDSYWPVYNKITVVFDAQGGKASVASKRVFVNGTYKTLATATRTGYTFAGWYTQPTGGTKITPTTAVKAYKSHKIYAHWVKKS